jgi:5-methylcytosine-specific restriction endonuclease McrA
MPTAPPRPCARCGRLISGRSCRCRPSARARGYDAEWAAYSRRWLARFPWCGQRLDGRFHAEHSRCVQQGVQVRARVTDHICSIANGGARLDPANHQSLCASCNTAKDASRRLVPRDRSREQKKYSPGIGARGEAGGLKIAGGLAAPDHARLSRTAAKLRTGGLPAQAQPLGEPPAGASRRSLALEPPSAPAAAIRRRP